jgi:hypothetical protein
MKALRLLLSVAMAVAALPMLAASAPAAAPGYYLWIEPETQTVNPGEKFTVRVMFNTPEGANSIGLDLGFDPAAVQITDIALGAAFPAGATLMPPMPAAIAEANLDGSLEGMAAINPFGVWTEAGVQEGLVITMVARSTSELTIARPIIGRRPDFKPMTPAVTPGEVIVEAVDPAAAAAPPDPAADDPGLPWGIIAGVIAVAALAGGIVILALRRPKGQTGRR